MSGAHQRAQLASDRQRRILITGFGPFPGAPRNPTERLVKVIAQNRSPLLGGTRLITHVFETSYAAVDRELPALLAQHRPRALLMFGVAPRRRHVAIELFARNASSRRQDAMGGRFSAPLATAAAQRRRASTPALKLLRSTGAQKMRVALSHDAGDYLCNYLYWHAIAASQDKNGPKLVSFIHVPMPRNAQQHCEIEQIAHHMLLAMVASLRSH